MSGTNAPAGVVDTVRVLAEGARYGVTFRHGLPGADQWDRIRYELNALPSGAWWQLEYLGYQIVLVNGPCHLVAGIDPATVPATVNGFTAYGKCIASVPAAYPAGTTTTSRVVLHEPGHACDLTTNPEYPYSRQGDWLAINDAHGWGDPGESWPEQFAWWCLFERYGAPYLYDNIRDYFRRHALNRGWYRGGSLHWPR